MDEKRKLEKIIFADIDKAKRDYSDKNYARRQVIEKELVKSPKAVEFLKKYNELEAQKSLLEKTIEAHGYRVCGYSSDKKTIAIHDSDKFPQLKSESNRQVEEKFENLKRDYTLKLFASGEEAMEVFASLKKELERLTK